MTEDAFTQSYTRWDARYQASNADAWALRPEVAREVQVAADAYREKYGDGPARAIDLGAGDGRHTLYLAERGFEVTAVDGAPAGIDLIQQKLDKASLAANLVVADLRDYALPHDIDLWVASYVIHLLPEPYAHIQAWQEHVRPGGICSVASRGRFDHDPTEYWFPADFELKQIFEAAGWFILHAREEDSWRPEMEILFRQRAVVAIKPEE